MLESPQHLRIAASIGMIVPAKGSATARAILPYMSRQEQIAYIGAPPDAAMLEGFAATVVRGYSLSHRDVVKARPILLHRSSRRRVARSR